jgi:hypothetical protein
MAKKKQEPVHSRSTSAADHDAVPEHPTNIEIGGKTYAPGDTVKIDGGEFVAEAVVQLPSSATSGVTAGTYSVVSEMQGNRKAYRAVVDGRLYPIRQYGTENQVIAKQRETSKGTAKTARAARPTTFPNSADEISLGSAAASILTDYLALEPSGPGRDLLVSELVVKHLGPEVERLRIAQAAIAKIPRDFLVLFASASEEKRNEIMALLK